MKSTTCPAPRRRAWARLLSLGAGMLALNLTTATAATTCSTIYASVGTNTGIAATGSYLATLSAAGQLTGGMLMPNRPEGGRSLTAGIGIDPVNNRLLYIDGNNGSGYGNSPTYARIYDWNGTSSPTELTVDAARAPTFADPTSEHQAGVDKAGVFWATRWNGAKTLYRWSGTGNATAAGGAISATAGDTDWSYLTDGDMAFDGVFDGTGTGRMWFASSNSTGQIVIYLVTRNLNTNPQTYTATRVAAFNGSPAVTPSQSNVSTGNFVSGLAFGPGTSKLYIATTGGDIYTYDLETGIATAVTSDAGFLLGNTNVRAITDLGSCAYPQPDLGISKTHAGNFQVWQPGTYTLTITNSGLLSTTRPIQIRDVLPTGMTFASASSSVGTVTGPAAGTSGAITMSFTPTSAIRPGESRTVTLNVNVGLSAAANSVNYASVGDGGDSFNSGFAPAPSASCTSHCASDPTTVLPPNPASVAKAFSPASVPLNGASTVTFTLSNPNSGGPLTNLNFTDTLTGMSVASTTIGGTCAATNSPALTVGATSLNLTVPSLGAGSSCTVTVSVKGTQIGVNPNTTSGVSSTETPTRGAVSNTANLTVTPLTPVVSKAFSPTSAPLGSTTQLTISVTNPNSVAAANFALTDDVATTTGMPGLTITAVSSDTCRGSGSVSVLNGRYALSGGTLPAAGCAVTLSVQVPTTATVGAHTNTIQGGSVSGSVNGQALPTPADATASVTVTAPALTVVKTGPDFVKPGETITYTLTVTNDGSAAADGTILSDQLPAGVAVTGSSPSAAVSGTTLSWTLGTLAPGATQTFTVTVTAPDLATLASTPGTRSLVNTAQVSTSSPQSTTAKNSSAVTTRVIAAQLVKTVRNVTRGTAFAASSGGVPGETLEYCIQVQNVGAVDLPNFTLTDSVPLNTAVQLGGFDAEEPSAATGFGVQLTRSSVTYLTSAADTDAAELTATGGAFSRGVLTVTLGRVMTGDQQTVCFRAAIR